MSIIFEATVTVLAVINTAIYIVTMLGCATVTAMLFASITRD